MSTSAVAEESAKPSIWSRAQDSLSKTWQSQDYELYVPINTWHNRSYYTQEKLMNTMSAHGA